MTVTKPEPVSQGKARLTSAIALLVWFGVVLQLVLSLQLAAANGKSIGQGLIVYFGFFTVLTNILVSLTLTWPLAAPHSRLGQFFAHASVRAGVAANILFVGIAYHLLLRHIWQPQGWQWLADMLLHYATPAIYSLYWGLTRPKTPLSWTDPLLWCLYPAAYFAYALARGPLVNNYPYPFIDVTTLGYGQTLLNALAMMVAFYLLSLMLVAATKLRN